MQQRAQDDQAQADEQRRAQDATTAQQQGDLQSAIDALTAERDQISQDRARLQTERDDAQQRAAQSAQNAKTALDNWRATQIEYSKLKALYQQQSLQLRQLQNHAQNTSAFPVIPRRARRWPQLGRNSSGTPVAVLRRLLRIRGANINVSNTFDLQTERAVRTFQRAQHLSVSGRADNATWEHLVASLQPATQRETARTLQILLNAALPTYAPKVTPLAITGHFDRSTQNALARFQNANGWPATAQPDDATWCLLAGGTLAPQN